MKFFKQQYKSYKKQFDTTKKKKNISDKNTKLFIGGLRQETTEETLHAHFSKYGEIMECNVLRDTDNQNRSRGFAYIDFANDSSAIAAMAEINRIDGKIVDLQWPKKDAPESKNMPYNPSKIFVGGITARVDETVIRNHFSTYGTVLSVTIMREKQDATRHRGFAYVLFQHESSVEETMAQYFSHRLDGKWVEVKPCVPKGKLEALENGTATSMNYHNANQFSWLYAQMQKQDDAENFWPKQLPHATKTRYDVSGLNPIPTPFSKSKKHKQFVPDGITYNPVPTPFSKNKSRHKKHKNNLLIQENDTLNYAAHEFYPATEFPFMPSMPWDIMNAYYPQGYNELWDESWYQNSNYFISPTEHYRYEGIQTTESSTAHYPFKQESELSHWESFAKDSVTKQLEDVTNTLRDLEELAERCKQKDNKLYQSQATVQPSELSAPLEQDEGNKSKDDPSLNNAEPAPVSVNVSDLRETELNDPSSQPSSPLEIKCDISDRTQLTTDFKEQAEIITSTVEEQEPSDEYISASNLKELTEIITTAATEPSEEYISAADLKELAEIITTSATEPSEEYICASTGSCTEPIKNLIPLHEMSDQQLKMIPVPSREQYLSMVPVPPLVKKCSKEKFIVPVPPRLIPSNPGLCERSDKSGSEQTSKSIDADDTNQIVDQDENDNKSYIVYEDAGGYPLDDLKVKCKLKNSTIIPKEKQEEQNTIEPKRKFIAPPPGLGLDHLGPIEVIINDTPRQSFRAVTDTVMPLLPPYNPHQSYVLEQEDVPVKKKNSSNKRKKNKSPVPVPAPIPKYRNVHQHYRSKEKIPVSPPDNNHIPQYQ